MRKSSRSISLALIGSALAISGCQPAVEDNEWSGGDDVVQTEPNSTVEGVATGNDQYQDGTHRSGGAGRTAARIGGAMIGSQIGRSMGGRSSGPTYGGGGMATSPSARGGFGSSGGFSASS